MTLNAWDSEQSQTGQWKCTKVCQPIEEKAQQMGGDCASLRRQSTGWGTTLLLSEIITNNNIFQQFCIWNIRIAKIQKSRQLFFWFLISKYTYYCLIRIARLLKWLNK